jgi:peptidyl-prolyl cis-trans isomerase D
MDSVTKTFKVDSGTEAEYNQAAGSLLAARHILIGFKNPTVPPTAAEKDSVRKKAEGILPQVTAANFADLAAKYSSDPTAKQNKGYLGVFAKGTMVAPFYDATATLKPGEISKLVETQFGFHIIQRLSWADAQKDFSAQYTQIAGRKADSVYRADATTAAAIQLKDNAPASIKDAARDPSKHRSDKGTLATFKGGELTVQDFMAWMETVPPQQGIMQRIPSAPDSMLKPFIKEVALQQVLLRRADSAKVTLKDEDKATMYTQIGQLVTNLESTLGVDPKMLADSAKSVPEKERLAAARVDAYLDRMMAGQAQPLTIPLPLKKMLDAKYDASVNAAGVDRGLERATKLRKTADSTRAASQPKTQIPLPGGAGAPPAGQPPQGAAPQPAPAPSKPATPNTKKP